MQKMTITKKGLQPQAAAPPAAPPAAPASTAVDVKALAKVYLKDNKIKLWEAPFLNLADLSPEKAAIKELVSKIAASSAAPLKGEEMDEIRANVEKMQGMAVAKKGLQPQPAAAPGVAGPATAAPVDEEPLREGGARDLAPDEKEALKAHLKSNKIKLWEAPYVSEGCVDDGAVAALVEAVQVTDTEHGRALDKSIRTMIVLSGKKKGIEIKEGAGPKKSKKKKKKSGSSKKDGSKKKKKKKKDQSLKISGSSASNVETEEFVLPPKDFTVPNRRLLTTPWDTNQVSSGRGEAHSAPKSMKQKQNPPPKGEGSTSDVSPRPDRSLSPTHSLHPDHVAPPQSLAERGDDEANEMLRLSAMEEAYRRQQINEEIRVMNDRANEMRQQEMAASLAVTNDQRKENYEAQMKGSDILRANLEELNGRKTIHRSKNYRIRDGERVEGLPGGKILGFQDMYDFDVL